jgi:hypothetical protein
VLCVAFTPDGRAALAGCEDWTVAVRPLQAATRERAVGSG